MVTGWNFIFIYYIIFLFNSMIFEKMYICFGLQIYELISEYILLKKLFEIAIVYVS